MPHSTLSLPEISRLAFVGEGEALKPLLARLETLPQLETEIMRRAVPWTNEIRQRSIGHGVESFLSVYGLNTEEGVALMCLAEALLRIPDAQTADALIREAFEGRHWHDYTHSGGSWLVHVSSWGLLLTGKVVDMGHDVHTGMVHVMKNLVGKMGEPVIRQALKKAMHLMGSQFVLGETVAQALQAAEPLAQRGYRFSFDILGEGARSEQQAKNYIASYHDAIEHISKHSALATTLHEAPAISIKLSALHPRYQLTQRERVMRELLPRVKAIALKAKQAGMAVAIDAEESSRLDIELALFGQLIADTELSGWDGLGFVVQAYQKRALPVIEWLAFMARQTKRIIPLRLVKGAYWDSEIKWAQMLGLSDYPVFTRKEHTDISYLACAQHMLECRDVFYPQFATHNARTIASVMAMAKQQGWPAGAYEFQRLHGMGEALHDLVLPEVPSRIYAPVGTHKDLLAYLIRRLLENSANSSFVHLLMDGNQPAETILADPLAMTKQPQVSALPLPPAIYADRANSSGIDFGNNAQLNTLLTGVAAHAKNAVAPTPPQTPASLSRMLTAAQKAFPAWAATPVDVRAAMLERAADLIEQRRGEWIALCAQEAGKTLPDGNAEVREAADFCRYYALQARRLFAPQSLIGPVGESNQLTLHPRGIFACISPWNFPLAIFCAQVAAALVTGNCVIAKPAEQTPYIASRMLELFYEAGVPREVVQLATGAGEVIGAALVADKRVDGVVFTGGTNTAQHIAQSLAARGAPLIPLIAETGGQNCMVVDSSALLEQAVDDILVSAFGSAGQRCSALRVLFVQDDIADALLALLAGAMQELKLGDPLDPSTDLGPVIDASAQAALVAHIQTLQRSAKLIAHAPLPEIAGHFVAPHAFEISDITQLTREHFGPVLHVIRFASGSLAQVIQAINSTGYGLTFGIHSRIEAHIRQLTQGVRAGNVYVNRSMIGATVGVQPFGGSGLSGTGPKAGGPHYLLRFVTERTLTVNTAAIGGNVALLAG